MHAARYSILEPFTTRTSSSLRNCLKAITNIKHRVKKSVEKTMYCLISIEISVLYVRQDYFVVAKESGKLVWEKSIIHSLFWLDKAISHPWAFWGVLFLNLGKPTSKQKHWSPPGTWEPCIIFITVQYISDIYAWWE